MFEGKSIEEHFD